MDEDACDDVILVSSMEISLADNIVRFEFAHQTWNFLRDRYESTSQSIYLAAIRHEQLIQQGDSTIDEFFAQM